MAWIEYSLSDGEVGYKAASAVQWGGGISKVLWTRQAHSVTAVYVTVSIARSASDSV